MSNLPELTPEEVCGWVRINVRRIKNVRMLLTQDIARLMGSTPKAVTQLLGHNHNTMSMKNLIGLANALQVTPAELVSRPDDMSVVDGRKTMWSNIRKRLKINATQEEQERQALLESLGMDE